MSGPPPTDRPQFPPEFLNQARHLATAKLALEDLLTRVANYAVQAIPGADGAGLGVAEEEEPVATPSVARSGKASGTVVVTEATPGLRKFRRRLGHLHPDDPFRPKFAPVEEGESSGEGSTVTGGPTTAPPGGACSDRSPAMPTSSRASCSGRSSIPRATRWHWPASACPPCGLPAASRAVDSKGSRRGRCSRGWRC